LEKFLIHTREQHGISTSTNIKKNNISIKDLFIHDTAKLIIALEYHFNCCRCLNYINCWFAVQALNSPENDERIKIAKKIIPNATFGDEEKNLLRRVKFLLKNFELENSLKMLDQNMSYHEKCFFFNVIIKSLLLSPDSLELLGPLYEGMKIILCNEAII